MAVRTMLDVLADTVGVKPDQLTDSMIETMNRAQVDRGLDPIDVNQEVADDFKLGEEPIKAPVIVDGPDKKESTETPKEPVKKETQEPWKLPEEQRDNFVPKNIVDEEYVPKAILSSDPLRDENHPAHEIVKESSRAASEAIRKAAEIQKKLDEVTKVAFNAAGGVVENDPARKIYGGISFEDVNDNTDTEHDIADWIDARDAYVNAERTKESDRLQREADEAARSEQERVAAEAAAKAFATERDSVVEKLGFDSETTSKYEKHFKDQGSVSVEEAWVGRFVIDAGGLEAIRAKALEEGKRLGGAEATGAIAKNLNKGTDLTNETGKGYTPKDNEVFTILPAKQYLALPDVQKVAYKREFERRRDAGTLPVQQQQ